MLRRACSIWWSLLVWELRKNLARVLVWRKQEDNFLFEHTPFPGEEMGALKKMFFVGSVTERHLFNGDHICLYMSGHQPFTKIKSWKYLFLCDNGKIQSSWFRWYDICCVLKSSWIYSQPRIYLPGQLLRDSSWTPQCEVYLSCALLLNTLVCPEAAAPTIRHSSMAWAQPCMPGHILTKVCIGKNRQPLAVM